MKKDLISEVHTYRLTKLIIDPQYSSTCHYLGVCPFVPVLEPGGDRQVKTEAPPALYLVITRQAVYLLAGARL